MRIVTCFSFKGGSGRTVAAANIGAVMASAKDGAGSIKTAVNKKTAVLDLDVFAAGTHRVFDISSKDLRANVDKCLQDYLLEEISAHEFVDKYSVTLEHDLMQFFRMGRAAKSNCRSDFTLFPSRPDPSKTFLVQKYHENLLLELLQELEGRGYEYVFIDGESGIRSMAEVALRLADVILMFFRITWQHIDGTLVTAKEELEDKYQIPFFLIPSCVPLVDEDTAIYKPNTPGLDDLRDRVISLPDASELSDYAEKHEWALDNKGRRVAGPGFFIKQGLCIHHSLFLEAEERVIVFDPGAIEDKAPHDYYTIAIQIEERCKG